MSKALELAEREEKLCGIMRCEPTYAAELRRLHAENKTLRDALTKIEQWGSHTSEYSINYGSKGERDLYRGIARAALGETK